MRKFKLNVGRIITIILTLSLCLLVFFTILINQSDNDCDIGKVDSVYEYSPCTIGGHSIGNFTLIRSDRCITNSVHSALTAECPSRLGNQMFSYAILYAVSHYNHRTAYMSPIMSNFISKYFKISLHTLDISVYKSTRWKMQYLPAKAPGAIRNLPPDINFKFCGSPQAWKYFDEIRPAILKEFKFHKQIKQNAENELSIAKKQFLRGQPNMNTTFIGMHIRRSDYLKEDGENVYIPSSDFYKAAMMYFKSKYSNAIFIVASDDILWGQKNFASLQKTEFLIHYIIGSSHEDGGMDLAVLSSCDHVIFGLGTFGFWAGYLNPGEVIYCWDCIINSTSSYFLQSPMIYGGDYANFVLPTWTGLTRDGKYFVLANRFDKKFGNT